LRNGDAIVLQSGRVCRWDGSKDRIIDSHRKALKYNNIL